MTRFAWMFAVGSVWVSLYAFAADDLILTYHYRPGQVLTYEGKQTMKVESTVSGKAQKFTSQTQSLREWRVVGVDRSGNARLRMTILRAKVEATGADGKKLAFDTDDPDAQNPLRAIVGKPLAELVVTPAGRIIELKESDAEVAGQFVAHLRTLLYPFPDQAISAGATWQNDLELPLPAPAGTNQVVRLRQTYRLEKVASSIATVNLATAPAEEIKDRALLSAIAQFLPGGKIELDTSRGVVRSVELLVDQEVANFAGADSEMRVTGSYREVLKDDVASNPPKP